MDFMRLNNVRDPTNHPDKRQDNQKDSECNMLEKGCMTCDGKCEM